MGLAVGHWNAWSSATVAIAAQHSDPVESASVESDRRAFDLIDSDELIGQKRAVIQVKSGEDDILGSRKPPKVGEVKHLKGSVGLHWDSQSSGFGFDVGGKEGQGERLREVGPDARNLGRGEDGNCGGVPVGDGVGELKRVGGRALKQVSVGDEAPRIKISARADQIAQAKTEPRGVLVDE